MSRLVAAVATAARCTSTAVEEAVGVLLGATRRHAAAAVRTVVGHGVLGDGLLSHALVLAARTGTDAAGAVRLLAEGQAPASAWSDYELRVAGEEAAEDTSAALPRVRLDSTARVVAAGQAAPADVVEAVRGGAGTIACDPAAAHLDDGLELLRALVDSHWIVAFAGAVGCAISPRPSTHPQVPQLRAALDTASAKAEESGLLAPASGSTDTADGPGAGEQEAGVVLRSDRYLPLLPAVP